MSHEYMPSEGIWYVSHKPNVKSASKIMKLSDLPDKWPLLHYYGYKDEVTSKVLSFMEDHESWTISDLVDVIFESISKQYKEFRPLKDQQFPSKIIETITDLE